MKPTCMRDRIIAVIRGDELDRVPFVQYDGMFPNQEVWDLIGRDNLGLLRWMYVYQLATPNCSGGSEEVQINGKRGVRNTLVTPVGTLTEERLYEPTYGTTAAHTHYVKERADYEVLLAYLRDTVVTETRDAFLRSRQELGEDGLPMVATARTAYQQLWVQWVSLEDLSLHLVDYPDLLAEVVAELNRIELEIFEVIYRVAKDEPLYFVDIPDNITAPTIGERYFRQYCLPLYQRLADMMAEVDVKVFAHMDGDLKPLWAAIGESGLQGIDSFSPPPDNDTSPADALAQWPYMRLFMNFPSSIHLAQPEVIYATAMDILQQAGASGQLQIQISENVPPGVWRTSYPQIVRAIHDFAGA
ncbi:MAG: hypothetical protein HPY69_04865 [Armatimonadetes bacterium]|nr:hypothetical protein [Armatimonadota bacterium]